MDTLFTTPPLNVFEHMALDDVLVQTYTGQRVLRFYNWTNTPAVTFGYAQFVREVWRETAACAFTGDLCRRPTGGGVVYHTDDMTFSLIFTSKDTPTEIYKNLHAAIQSALAVSGVGADVFDTKLPPVAYAPSQANQANVCFVRPVENDLLASNGQKMLGGAIRRFGDTILYQGSLQVPGARTNPALQKALTQGVCGFWQTQLSVSPVSPGRLQVARRLAAAQYNTPAWTEKF